MSVKQVADIYKSVISGTEYEDLADVVDNLAPGFSQAPEEEEYINSQYDLVSGKLASNKNEIMLVLDSNDQLTDFFLAGLGYYTQTEFMEAIHKATDKDEKGNPVYNEALYRQYFSYEELLGKTFAWYPTDSVFGTEKINIGGKESVIATYIGEKESKGADCITLEVVGILTPKDNISYGVMSSGIYYTKALTDYALKTNANSNFVNYLKGIIENNKDSTTAKVFLCNYDYDYLPYDAFDGEKIVGERKTESSAPVFSAWGDRYENVLRAVGGNDLANSIKIYPNSFDEKALVTEYLDKWNDDTRKDENGVEQPIIITLSDGRELTSEMRMDITYTDSLELIVNMLNTMIDIISYALIAFTSISLVVSTVMIGIITYVSVVERIKEIGVIRSLGGRKKDVSNLFIAETAIIGFLAGVIGIAVTYLISALVNVILTPLINFSGIAALPVGNAVFLVCLSVGLTLISGLAPAKSAAKKDPVVALRTE